MWIWPITLLLKDLRIPLFPFLRLNVVVSDRVHSLLIFYLRRFCRLLYFRLLSLLLHPADRGGDPKYNLHLLPRSMDSEGGFGDVLQNLSKEHFYH